MIDADSMPIFAYQNRRNLEKPRQPKYPGRRVLIDLLNGPHTPSNPSMQSGRARARAA